jgi:hypothetical protein
MHTNTDVRQREKETLEQMFLEGVRSGRGIEVGPRSGKSFGKSSQLVCIPNKYNHRYEAWRVTRD